MAGTSGTFTPRQVDHEAMALVVTAYHVLDAYLHTTQSLPPSPTRYQHSHHPQTRGPHVVDDWVELVQSFGALMKSGEAATVELESSSNSPTSTGASAALLEKMINSGRNAAVWRIFFNIYSCATYLVSLCDPTGINVSSHAFYEAPFH